MLMDALINWGIFTISAIVIAGISFLIVAAPFLVALRPMLYHGMTATDKRMWNAMTWLSLLTWAVVLTSALTGS